MLFVHGSFIHLALNMLALWMLGQSLEPMLGRARFLALYLISGLGGSVAVALLAPWTRRSAHPARSSECWPRC